MNSRHFLAASGGAVLSACPVCFGAARADEKGQRQAGLARVDAGPPAGGFAQSVADCVLDSQRGEGQALQR